MRSERKMAVTALVKKVVVGITGATGALYGIRAIELLRGLGVETHLVISRWGKHTIEHETSYSLSQVRDLADSVHAVNDLGAEISSGSFITEGMIVAPCSSRTLAAIAAGLEDNLLTRAASVTLKERRRLVLMVRETPLSEIHLQNMLRVTHAGGVILPPLPSFYTKLETIEELIDYTVVRSLDLFGFGERTDPGARWQGLPPTPLRASTESPQSRLLS